MHEAGTATLAQMLVNGELDLALIRGDREHEQIRQTLLVEDQIAACVPIEHPFAQRQSISLEELCQQPLVLFKKMVISCEKL
ncbi:LysR family transcriptional regulator substrate-binding protein [Vibrio sinaloensis]|nr:LysR family transcriptional regulator substrate-binding protein [Vibrio sinaloensis]